MCYGLSYYAQRGCQVLYTVGLYAIFWKMNSSVWVIWAAQASNKDEKNWVFLTSICGWFFQLLVDIFFFNISKNIVASALKRFHVAVWICLHITKVVNRFLPLHGPGISSWWPSFLELFLVIQKVKKSLWYDWRVS